MHWYARYLVIEICVARGSHYGRNLIREARIRVLVNPGSSITVYVSMCWKVQVWLKLV
jgi:hypothetical protein